MEIIGVLCILSIYLTVYTDISECYDRDISCGISKKENFVKIDCSSRGLKVIPDFCQNIQLLNDTTSRKIPPSEIRELDLSGNHIEYFNYSSFYCLKNLLVLNLERNHINLSSKNYIEGLFTPLVSLQDLNLKHNSKDGLINDSVFADLRVLQVLKSTTVCLLI